MKTLIILVGVILIICGLIGFGYAAVTAEQTNAIIGWVGGIILIIIGAYLAGKELKKKEI
jgi:arginine exporter protein ArgO